MVLEVPPNVLLEASLAFTVETFQALRIGFTLLHESIDIPASHEMLTSPS